MAPKQDKGKVDKNKQKAIDDKTFGLKNKSKSAKVQKYVQTLEKAAQQTGKQQRAAAADPEAARKAKKKAEEERQKELNALFAVAIKQPKVPLGVDPKSIVCEFFRHGQCTKGFKCKYSHDLGVERKGAKIDLFTDRRAGGEEGEPEELDQETLERMVAEKHTAENKNRPTDIICKFFLDAVERKQYGWFWKCPNGDACKYRHALPPGYVLKSQMKELLEEEARNVKDVSEAIEEERAKVDARTPITQQVMSDWLASKREAKRKARDDADAERRKKGIMTGREIFQQEGFTAVDDAAAGGDDDYQRDDEEERRIQEMFAQAQANLEAARAREAAAEEEQPSSSSTPEPPAAAAAATTLKLAEGDEDLFDDDDDDDLDDDELQELEQQLAGASVNGS